VVLDKSTKTRELVEKSGPFAIQVLTAAQLQMTHGLGTRSLFDQPSKLVPAGATLFEIDGYDLPCVTGCPAWLACTVIPEPHNQDADDLFIGEVIAAWADDRIFQNGHWRFEHAKPAWRSLRHWRGIAGSHR
jgi:flavin reductase (DIM6/NTAB) family NADH-FMN oxidoreductase RutF